MPSAHDQFAALYADTRAELFALVGQVGAGEIGPRQFGDLAAAILEEAHTEAVVIGRHHAGDRAPVDADDRAFAARVVDGEAEFLAGFVSDLEAGRYEDEDGNFRLAGAERRAEYYSNRLAATATDAWTLTLPETTTLYYWQLSPAKSESHCGDCPSIAARSPYRLSELPTVPLRGETMCLMQCACNLRTAAGQTGFGLPSGD